MRAPDHTHGFTLIELLVVVTILGGVGTLFGPLVGSRC